MSTEESNPKPKKKKKKLLSWLLALVVLVFAVILGVEAILCKVISGQLQKNGVKFNEVKVVSVGLRGIETIEINNLSFPPSWNLRGVSIEKVVVGADYNFSELLKDKKLTDLVIKDIELSVDVEALNFEKKEKEPLNIKALPQMLFDSLPETLPLDKFEIESGALSILRQNRQLFSLPFQLRFEATGKLEAQAPNFQFNTTYNRKMGHAIAKLQYQLSEIPDALTELLGEEFKNIPDIKGLAVSCEVSIANQQFKDASLSLNISELQSEYGNLQKTVFKTHCTNDLLLHNLSFESDFIDLDTEQFMSSDGRVELSLSRDLPASLNVEINNGNVMGQPLHAFSLKAKVQKSKIDANGTIGFSTGETFNWSSGLDHPYIARSLKWTKAPTGDFPKLNNPAELLNSIGLVIGPSEVEDSELLNPFVTGLPSSLVTGTLKLERKPGEKVTTITLDGAGIEFPESGFQVSGVDTSFALNDPPKFSTVRETLIKIEKIEFGGVVLRGGEWPLQIIEGEQPIITTKQVTFSTLGGSLTIHPYAVSIEGYDTITFPRVSIEGIEAEEVQKLIGELPVQTTGRINGNMQLKYGGQRISIMSGGIQVAEGAPFKIKYDASEEFSKNAETYTPEWQQLKRLETVLSIIEVTELKIEKNPDIPFQFVVKAKHKSENEDIALSFTAILAPGKEEAPLTLNAVGSLAVHEDLLPYRFSFSDSSLDTLSSWISSPESQLPKLPEVKDLLHSVEASIGPVILEDSKLLNHLDPTLPDTVLSGTFLAFRKAKTDIVELKSSIDQIHVPEQELTIKGLSASPKIQYAPALKTVEMSNLNVKEIQVKKWALKNAAFPWQILPANEMHSSVLQTTGGSFDTLGGKLILGPTAVELKGSKTKTTGLLRLENIDFKQITDLAETPPLVLNGIFDGTLPFSFENQSVDLQKGFLQMQSMSDGHLEYDAMGRFTKSHEPGSRGWKNMDMAERALKNLQISDIKLEFKPETDPDLPLRAYIKGSHESNNKKINLELTLNLRGDIKEILQQAATGKLELVP